METQGTLLVKNIPLYSLDLEALPRGEACRWVGAASSRDSCRPPHHAEQSGIRTEGRGRGGTVPRSLRNPPIFVLCRPAVTSRQTRGAFTNMRGPGISGGEGVRELGRHPDWVQQWGRSPENCIILSHSHQRASSASEIHYLISQPPS